LPNHDGSFSLLIEGKIHKNSKDEPISPFTGEPFDFRKRVFNNAQEAEHYLTSQNKTLADLLRDSVGQIVNKRPGKFIQSSISDWRISEIGVLVGDAGSCAPPWAGFGMNLACSHADDLARQIAAEPNNLSAALGQYSHRRVRCSEEVKKIIDSHGALLTSGMALKKWRHEEKLRDRREQILEERSPYQIVAFDERGLEMLAGLE
jgi:flavin-dependent dehydrogenase